MIAIISFVLQVLLFLEAIFSEAVRFQLLTSTKTPSLLVVAMTFVGWHYVRLICSVRVVCYQHTSQIINGTWCHASEHTQGVHRKPTKALPDITLLQNCRIAF